MAHEPIMPPTHPGIILRAEFLEPLGMTDEQLATDIGVAQTDISAITSARLGISADVGLRLSRRFGMSDGFWIGLQRHYESELAKDRAVGARYPDRPSTS
jgi:addiction module HigA family antidote